MTASARVFFVGGAISYRALFNWISPGMYVTTMLGSPLFQILFFTYLGRYAGSQDDSFFIVGNAIQVAAMAGIYGMTMGIANERQYGTLQPLLAKAAEAGARGQRDVRDVERAQQIRDGVAAPAGPGLRFRRNASRVVHARFAGCPRLVMRFCMAAFIAGRL